MMDDLINWLEVESQKCFDKCASDRLSNLQTCADIINEFYDNKNK